MPSYEEKKGSVKSFPEFFFRFPTYDEKILKTLGNMF